MENAAENQRVLDDPGVLAIDHVGVASADLNDSLAFYRELLGLVETHRESNEDQQVVEVMLAAPGHKSSDRSNETEPATQLQLLAPLSADSTVAKFLDRSGPGMHHLALRVSDIQATSDRLLARGLRLLYPQPRAGTAGSMINFIHPKDAGGVLVELVQPARS
ncbi:methylmalonyl-CoA epimerase [Microlunatus elymi]|uniref:Methylmalonyl-CoA epimerase n=1 Tax=Microlunatus elymi TaxID=2596828 RepID=A0A516Q0S4_9ACTN|nr:methylmalonyl-CoA epimerase [Microlunatus elymi]QDP97034.1 methylmalonyl-CoA epimerase [Microlunatus elymi]